ncbi:hypothetical protein ACULNC_16015 [Shigella flexneri]
MRITPIFFIVIILLQLLKHINFFRKMVRITHLTDSCSKSFKFCYLNCVLAEKQCCALVTHHNNLRRSQDFPGVGAVFASTPAAAGHFLVAFATHAFSTSTS